MVDHSCRLSVADPMPDSLTIEDSKFLVELCRAGRLYAVQRWIESGKSTCTAPEIKKTPLDVTVALGFHSLVELLVQAESCQDRKNRALAGAVEKRRLDMVEVLVGNGAQVGAVPLADVLCGWEPAIMDFFLDHGADVVAGAPFATAFGEKIRTALRPFREYKNSHPELAAELQGQADRALRHFAYQGDLKWVSLMLWLGADPRSRGPTLHDEYEDDPECYTTAFEEACSKGNLEVLKKLRLDPARDELSALLRCASLFAGKETIGYLLEQGADPNDKANGGSSALARCIQQFRFGGFRVAPYSSLTPPYAVRETMDSVRLLVSRGARWIPENKGELNSVRRVLLGGEAGGRPAEQPFSPVIPDLGAVVVAVTLIQQRDVGGCEAVRARTALVEGCGQPLRALPLEGLADRLAERDVVGAVGGDDVADTDVALVACGPATPVEAASGDDVRES